MNINPAIANRIRTGSFETNYHEAGEGFPLLLIHGSGPGVTAWANWSKVIPQLAPNRRVIAPDMVGFGYSDRPAGMKYNMDIWVRQAIDLLDALNIQETDVVGNSFGGALAIALAVEIPDRIRRMVLMGSMGVEFPITHGLDAVWGYEASVEDMRKVLDLFAYNRDLLSEELAQLRYKASVEPGFQESFSSMFPAPRQPWVASMARYEDRIPEIGQPTLIVHGREDQVIPMETSLKLLSLIHDAQLHVFGRCGHWTQIEHTDRFCRLVNDFLSE